MKQITRQVTIDAPLETVYSIIADVEKYPDFLPGVDSVDVRDDLVTMRGRLGPLSITLKCRTRFNRNESILLELVDGPFRAMNGRWTFVPVSNGTLATYTANYELGLALRMPGIKAAIESAFRANVEQIVTAFRERILRMRAGALANEGNYSTRTDG